jgi:hypothetical protein
LLCSEAYTGDTEEEPTQHHIIKGKKWRKQRTIKSVHLGDGQTVFFREHCQTKYGRIQNDNTQYKILLNNSHKLPAHAKDAMALPITRGELYYTIQNSQRNKAPGIDGISYEFYTTHWKTIKDDLLTIMNEM